MTFIGTRAPAPSSIGVQSFAGNRWNWNCWWRSCALTRSSFLFSGQVSQVGCCQADSPIVRPGDSAWSRARHPSECPCARFPSAKGRHPRHPSVNPCFMMSALLMYRCRAFPSASSAITASELTSSNTTRTSFALLGPSKGLADTAPKKAMSTRSAALVQLSPHCS